MVTDPRKPDELETAMADLFDVARCAETPSDDLVARVLEDAACIQTELAVAARMPVRTPQPDIGRGWFAEAIAAVGGWPGFSGVTLAGVTGVMLGLYAPDLVDTWSGGQIWNLAGGAGVTPEIGSLWVEDGDV